MKSLSVSPAAMENPNPNPNHDLPPPSPPPPSPPIKPINKSIVFLAVTVVALTILLLYSGRDSSGCLVGGFTGSTSKIDSTESMTTKTTTMEPDPDVIRVLIGILTVATYPERRHMLRQVYAIQQAEVDPAVQIDIRFVYCNLTEDERTIMALDMLMNEDIIILNCTENMNEGKTFTYFSSLPSMFPRGGEPGDGSGGRRPYDYVMKADDDAFFKLPNFARAVMELPGDDVYWGSKVPCEGSTPEKYRYFAGYGYMLSWDVVEWIAATPVITEEKKNGIEDAMVGHWLREGGKGKRRFDMNPRTYDYMEGTVTCYRHEFWADTIAVHKLKNQHKWAKTIEYFNLTRGLKPSKMNQVAFPRFN